MQAILPDEVLFLLNHWDAPAPAKCPKCGCLLRKVYDLGSIFTECTNDGVFGCYFTRRAE